MLKHVSLGKILTAGTVSALACLGAAFFGIYRNRLKSMRTIQKLTHYADGFDLYQIDILYDYRLDDILKQRFSDNLHVTDAILKHALPFLPVRVEPPDYACSAFGVTDADGDVLMGRNYDFDSDTSAIIVRCAPANGYRSIGVASLDHVGANRLKGFAGKLMALPTPYICVEGINEKGVSIAVLMLDSESTKQDTERPDMFTTLAVRLVLDHAATTAEAVALFGRHDMFAMSGGDYHFFVTDASGDSRVLEYDCHSKTRELVDTPVRTATNFYQIYIDKVLPNRKNGIYGHGKERYDMIEEILSEHGDAVTKDIAWKTLEAVWQLPKEDLRTSNTQWSVLYNNTKRQAEIEIRRHRGDRYIFRLPAS